MACDCCCSNILRLCKVSVCPGSEIDFGINANATGIYKMVIEFMNTKFTVEKEIADGEGIKFPTEGLNENFTFVAQLYKPDGTRIVISKDAVEYDCFEFQTQMSYVVNP